MNGIKVKILMMLLVLLAPIFVLAEGNVTVDKNSISLGIGETSTFVVKADNAAGRIDFKTSNPNIVTLSSEKEWFDKDSKTITVTAVGEGSATITVELTDVATYDSEPLTNTYTIDVKVKSNDSSLQDLKVDGVTVTGFNANTKNYNLTISGAKKEVSVAAVATNSNATLRVEGNQANLQYGQNVVKVIVTSESGKQSTEYILNINREDNRSKVNTLKTLTATPGAISFSPEKESYNITVNSDISKININSTLTDPKSTYVNGYGNRTVNLNYGNNSAQVKAQAENGTVKTYTINIYRTDGRSKENSLQVLTVNKGSLVFNPNVLEYNLNLDYSVEELKIDSKLKDNKAKYVEGYGNRTVKLNPGNNTILIKVKAENETEKTYTINAYRNEKELSNNNKIKKISIKDYEIDFNEEKTNYKIEYKNYEKLDITIELEDNNAKYEIIGNENLKEGSTITIKVISESGEEKDYKIKLEKEENKKNIDEEEIEDKKEEKEAKKEKAEENKTTGSLIFLALSVAFFIFSIIYHNKKNK